MSIRTALVVWTFALGLSAVAGALVVASDHEPHKGLTLALAVSVGLAFVSSGLVAWVRRPDNGTGRLMTFVGFVWFVSALGESNRPLVFTIGAVLSAIPIAALVHLLLAFPRGYLESRARIVVAVAYVAAIVAPFLILLFDDSLDERRNLPENLLLVEANDTVANALSAVFGLIGIAVVVATIAIFVQRWRAAGHRLRRQLGPVYASATVTLVLVGLRFATNPVSDWDAGLAAVALVALLTVPLSFLFVLLQGHLTRAEERNRALLDAVPDLLFVFTRDGRYTNVKAEREDLLVAPAEELVGSSVYDVLPRDVADGVLAAIRRALDEDGLQTCEYELDVDGTVRSFEARLVPSGADEVTGIVRDFTELRMLEGELKRRFDELRVSEGRLRALFESAPAAIAEVDLENRVTSWNPAAERIFGWTREEILGRPVPFVPDEDMEMVERVRARTRAGETVTGIEGPRFRKDGSLVHVEVSVAPVRDAAGNVISHLAVFADITERRRLSDQTRREGEFIRAVVNNTSALFCVVDSEGRIIRFNRACERTTGYDDDDAVRGRRFWEVFVAPADREEALLALADVVAGRAPAEQENVWVTKDGGSVVIAWTVVPILDEEGIGRFLISGADVTERVQHEDELAASRARLVAAADAERRRLERNLHDGAQQRLVALSLALRLAKSRLPDDPAGASELLDAAGEELAQGLAELRELARGIHPAVLSDRGLGPALEMLADRAPLPVELASLPGERLPEPVEAAAYYLVSEALTNVARYARASAVTVRVARGNGRVVVEVADDGVGGADPEQGSGLRGLADRVAALRGRLEVESPPGEGTRLRAEIPCA